MIAAHGTVIRSVASPITDTAARNTAAGKSVHAGTANASDWQSGTRQLAVRPLRRDDQ